MGKRKIGEELQKNAAKNKKTNATTKSIEALENEKLTLELKKLHQDNEILLREKEENLQVILMLEETIKLMEKKENAAKVEQKSASIQTEVTEAEIMRCNECEYPAEDIYDLGEHMYEFHATAESYDEKI